MEQHQFSGTDNDTKAEVLVKAQIVDDLFKITDIDGKPLVLDFKKVPKRDYTKWIVKAYVEYKITANDSNYKMSNKFKMEVFNIFY